MNFANMKTTNQVAFEVQKDFPAKLPSRVNLNRPFLKSMIVVEKATKSSMSAEVGFDSRARARDIPNLLEEGEIRKPQGKSIAFPTDNSRSGSMPLPKANGQALRSSKGRCS
jgi:hypothetical protein